MSSDTNAGQVGPGVAEMLGIPAITCVQKISVENDKVITERVLADGYEVVESALPCLVTVSHEIGELRTANVKGLMAAQKQPFTTWTAEDLVTDPSSIRQDQPLELYKPEREINCEIVPGETPEEAGANLAIKLHEIKQV
jgi:electron transfer flavoprotein beta subunit